MTRCSLLAMVAGGALLALSACGGGGGTVSTPTPPVTPAPAPAPTPTPAPTTNDDTVEYERSNGAVQAGAIAAYRAGATGAGITVGILDSGVAADNAEFAGRISPQSADLVANRGINDEGGHGTAVADVLLGAKNDSGIHGIAFAATLLVLRADTVGSCAMSTADADKCTFSDTALARGVDTAVAARAKVVNISLGGTPANASLRASINRATAAGTIIVISAGNDFDTDPVAGANPDLLAQIASDPVSHGLVLIAGATDATKTITGFSNRAGSSSAYYLTALGDRVRSIDQTGTAFLFGGTSFSTPLVAGAVALLSQTFPTLTPAQIVDLLLRTATDLGDPGVDPVYGHGELNLDKAFAPQGAMSIAGQAIALANNAVLATAMGDAAATTTAHGLVAKVRDGYGRAYTLDLAPTIRTAARQMKLAPALAVGTTSLAAARGDTVFGVAFAEADQSQLPNPVPRRAIAGSVVTRVGGGRTVAFGIAESGAALLGALGDEREAPLLIAERSDAGVGFARLPRGAFAVRQDFGRFTTTMSVEQGSLSLARLPGDPVLNGISRPGYVSAGWRSQARFGPARLLVGVTRLDEADTILGGRFAAGLGGGGATSWFGDLGVGVEPAAGWRLDGLIRRGRTQLAGGAVRAASVLASQALSIDATHSWPGGAFAALRWSEPLRVTHGGLDLAGFDVPTRLDLAPHGHERVLEASYGQGLGTGSVTGNLYWRRQPGNDARVADDQGLALRYAVTF